MTRDQQRQLVPIFVIFLITSTFWLIFHAAYYQFIFLALGLLLGSFFLDVDHLVYWLYLSPNTEESRLAKAALFKYDYRSIIKLVSATEKQHTSLIFHHFFFQVILTLISFFVFTSSNNVFGMSFLLAINIHLLTHEHFDLKLDPTHLQDWLFAREKKQLPQKFLHHYVFGFTAINLVFFVLFLKSIV